MDGRSNRRINTRFQISTGIVWTSGGLKKTFFQMVASSYIFVGLSVFPLTTSFAVASLPSLQILSSVS